MTDPKPKIPGRGKHGNQGRKPSKRELVKITPRIYKDQLPVSSDEIRKALEWFREMLKDNKNTTDESI